ncbi:MAG: hypothetical protein ACI9Y1_001654 [Lentisphaeria bacterium]|jgi:hypothetical protein
MLDVNPEIVCFLIRNVRDMQAQEDSGGKEPLDAMSDAEELNLAQSDTSPILSEFISTVNDLEPDQQQKCTCIVVVGAR